LYAEWFFIEGEKVCQLNGELQVDICTKESYILLYDFDQGFTITPGLETTGAVYMSYFIPG